MRWLIVFDNAEESGLLLSCWPSSSNGSIIITSRNKYIAKGLAVTAKVIHVAGLTKEEGEEFLLSRLGLPRNSESLRQMAQDVTDRFCRWPLALRQVSAFLEESQLTLEDFRDLLRREATVVSNLYDVRDDSSPYEATLQSAWNPILAKLPRNSTKLLNVLSLLDPDRIPSSMFSRDGLDRAQGVEFLPTEFEYVVQSCT